MKNNTKKEPGGTVRITAGKFKGRKIRTPGGRTHPMGERERIALFNMIADRVVGNYVMDLYCGGGTLGIEAISRGANFALCIDNNPRAVDTAKDNLVALDIDGVEGMFLPPRSSLGQGTGKALLGDIPVIMRTATDRYGIVIADPPYDEYDEKMIKYLPRVVLDGGVLVLSHPGEPPELHGVRLDKTHKYAGATISVYIKD